MGQMYNRVQAKGKDAEYLECRVCGKKLNNKLEWKRHWNQAHLTYPFGRYGEKYIKGYNYEN